MSLSSSTLAAIQKAGAAAFSADEKLKQAAKNYADRVHAAIAANPYNQSNDTLIENWKTVARLSQTLVGIEAEIKKVFQIATELTSSDQPIVLSAPVVAAPKRAATKVDVVPVVKFPIATGKTKTAKTSARAVVDAPVVTIIELDPTDVVIKSKKKSAKPQVSIAVAPKKTTVKEARVSKPAVAKPAEMVVKPMKKAAAKAKVILAKHATAKVQSGELSGNAAKLLPQLERVLNTNDFVEISQTAISKEADIALGSMTAALKKLMELGRITAGPTGSYKLAQPALAAVATDAVVN